MELVHSKREFFSHIFLTPKKKGIEYRMILNLTELNKSVVYQHSKMDSLKCDPRVLDGLSRHKRYLLHCAGSSGTPKPFQIYIVGQTLPIYLLTFWSSLSKKNLY